MSQTSVKEFPERKCSLDVVGKQCFGECPFNALPTQCMPISFAMLKLTYALLELTEV